jgi:D-alanyl-D-alanine dipeptidase
MKKMQKNITIILVVVSLFSCRNKGTHNALPGGSAAKTEIAIITQKTDTTKPWKEIDFNSSGMIANIVYADTLNFMREKIYDCAKCFLRPEAYAALLKANELAKKQQLKLMIFDCYRPKIYQIKMYNIVKNPDYVALPGKGSMHNKGLAIDIGLADINGKMLDMGSAFDEFSEKAHYTFSNISPAAKANRKKLREIMVISGFKPYDKEWWHFNYTAVNYPTDDFIWNCN